MSWNLTKDDKLDFTDKDLVIKFFEDDLKRAEKEYKRLDDYKKRGFKVPTKFWMAARADIVISKKNLALAKSKLGMQ